MTARAESIRSVLIHHGLRLLVGGIFLYAGYVKIIDPFGFAKNIYQYQILPDYWVNVSALLLPWLEVICGAALIFVPRMRRGAAAWTLLMLTVFTAAVLFSIYRGLDISCGCLSTSPDAAKIGWRKVAENIALTAFTVIIFIRAGRHPSVRPST